MKESVVSRIMGMLAVVVMIWSCEAEGGNLSGIVSEQFLKIPTSARAVGIVSAAVGGGWR